MNLIEAIKTGRNLRRQGRSQWAAAHGNTYIVDSKEDNWMSPFFYIEVVGVDQEDLLANDWEIQNESD